MVPLKRKTVANGICEKKIPIYSLNVVAYDLNAAFFEWVGTLNHWNSLPSFGKRSLQSDSSVGQHT
jgi:hypothetical protein